MALKAPVPQNLNGTALENDLWFSCQPLMGHRHIMIRCLKRIALSLGLLLGSITFIVWFLWIPSAQEPTYIFYEAWGEAGSNPGQFRDPTGIAVTADEVFVSDARNSRIQVFDHHGRFKHQITGRGLPAAELGRPMNLDIHRGELYAADYWNDCIQVYALDGTHRRNIGTNGSEPEQFNSPGGVAVDVPGESRRERQRRAHVSMPPVMTQPSSPSAIYAWRHWAKCCNAPAPCITTRPATTTS